MKRTTLMAGLTGAAVLIAGCSSTSGTAAPASSAASAAASAVATSSSTMSSMSESMAPTSMASSSMAPSSMAPSSMASSSMAPTSSEASSSEAPTSSEASSSASSSKAPVTTVGNTSGGLDPQSAAWLSTFCGGLKPLADVAKNTSGLGGTDTTAVQKTLVNLYSSIGSSFTSTAAKLKPLPAPTFSGGQAFATKVVSALGTAGPTFTANAKKLAAIDVKKNPTAFAKELQNGSKDLTTATGPLNDLNSLKLTAQTEAAIEKLPACAALKAAGG